MTATWLTVLVVLNFQWIQQSTAQCGSSCAGGGRITSYSYGCLSRLTYCYGSYYGSEDGEAIPFAQVEAWDRHIASSGSCPGTRGPSFYNNTDIATTVKRLEAFAQTQRLKASYKSSKSLCPDTFKFSDNFFSDFTTEELIQSLGDEFVATDSPTKRPTKRPTQRPAWKTLSNGEQRRRLPVDSNATMSNCTNVKFLGWPETGWNHAVDGSDVDSQGSSCGSCWAFAATSSMEHSEQYHNGHSSSSSEQELLDCSGGGDCVNGVAKNALEFAAAKGVCSDDGYPGGLYSGKQGVCDPNFQSSCNSERRKPSRVYCFTPSRRQLELSVQFGVPTVSMDWPRRLFLYGGGVFKCSPDDEFMGGHALTLVGHGFDAKSGLHYWRLKNQWTQCWGEEGYVRIDKNTAHFCRLYNRRKSVIPDFTPNGAHFFWRHKRKNKIYAKIEIDETQCRAYFYGSTNLKNMIANTTMNERGIQTFDSDAQKVRGMTLAGSSCCHATMTVKWNGEELSIKLPSGAIVRDVAEKVGEKNATIVRASVTCDPPTSNPTASPSKSPIVPTNPPSSSPTVKKMSQECTAFFNEYLPNILPIDPKCRNLVCLSSFDGLKNRCDAYHNYLVKTQCVVHNFGGFPTYTYVCACLNRLPEFRTVLNCGQQQPPPGP